MRTWVSLIFSALVAISSFFLLPLFPFSHKVYAAVVINEILPKPGQGDQWIELYNNGDQPVSLAGWKLENTTGEKKNYTVGPNTDIAAHGFLTFPQGQTTIALNKDGDTVTLRDNNGNQVDSQGYPGILGYNFSMGRTVDGAGVWAACTDPATYNQPNNCPTPTATPTPLPTNSPTPSFTPTPTVLPTPPPVSTNAAPPLPQPEVLGVDLPTATPTPSPDVFKLEVPKMVAAQILIVVGAWGLLALAAYLGKKNKQKKRKTSDG